MKNWFKRYWIPLTLLACYIGSVFALVQTEIARLEQDRDVWLILECGHPRLVLFIKNNGELDSHSITHPSELAELKPRATATPHKYAVALNQACGILTREPLGELLWTYPVKEGP